MSEILSIPDATTLPARGTWSLDPGHTEVGFIGRHFMLTKVRARFLTVTGTVEVAEEPADSVVVVEIDMASVSSGSRERDEHLRSADLFDVANYPTAVFRSRRIDWDGSSGTMAGDLTIKGVTNPVTLEISLLGALTDPWGNERVVFSASGQLNREDWGITWNVPLAGGGLLVSKEIRLEVEGEAVRQS